MPPDRLRRLLGRGRAPRLLVAIPGGEYGGAERYAVRIAAAAAAQGWEVAAAVRRYDAVAPLRRDLAAAGVRVLLMARGERARELIGFTTMLSAYRPDVVHLTLPWPVAAGRLRAACALLGVPAVLVHAATADAAEIDVRHAWLYRLARRRRQRWVAVSGHGSTMLRQAFDLRPADEIAIIRNAPRPASDGAPGSGSGSGSGPGPGAGVLQRDAARELLGIGTDRPLIVSVGRLTHEKGHDVLIAATAQLVREWPDLRVLIAGEGSGREGLQRMIDEAGLRENVALLGQRDDIPALLQAADVFAFPSRREGAPLAVLEAMGAGVPVVATDFGGIDEIIDSQVNGIIVARDDPASLAVAVAGLIRDPTRARAVGDRGRQRAAQFSEPEMIRTTLDLLSATAQVRERR